MVNEIPTKELEHAARPAWDVFICHASEDKSSVVEPLAHELQKCGLKVWYDLWELHIGDSLRRKIDEGLSRSRWGIVVLSPAFFAKEWPQRELDGLVQRESLGLKVILPVWHNVSREKVLMFSPPLADKVAASTSEGIAKVAARLLRATQLEQLSRTRESDSIRIVSKSLQQSSFPTYDELRILIEWLGANAVAGACAWFLAWNGLRFLPTGQNWNWALWGAYQGLLSGVFLGAAQGFVLWRARRISRWWILATAAAWCAGGSFSSWQFGDFYSAFAGAVVALAQWLVLRRRVARAGQWIVAATVAWAVGQFLGMQAFYGASESPLYVQGLLGGAVSCLVFAAVSGLPLLLLLRRAQSRP